jgi:hypothetical protein
LEPSSGAFSAGAFDGVAARDVSFELSAEAALEPGRAFSADRSAMAVGMCCSCKMEKMKEKAVLVSGPTPRTSSDVVVKCGSALQTVSAWRA